MKYQKRQLRAAIENCFSTGNRHACRLAMHARNHVQDGFPSSLNATFTACNRNARHTGASQEVLDAMIELCDAYNAWRVRYEYQQADKLMRTIERIENGIADIVHDVDYYSYIGSEFLSEQLEWTLNNRYLPDLSRCDAKLILHFRDNVASVDWRYDNVYRRVVRVVTSDTYWAKNWVKRYRPLILTTDDIPF